MSLKPSTVSFRSLAIGARFVRTVSEDSPIYTKETPTSFRSDEGNEHHLPSHLLELQVFEIYYGEDV